MVCNKCKSKRIAVVVVQCGEYFLVRVGKKVYEGYVPPDIGLGKEDDIVEFSTCLDCGQMRGKFPLKPTGLEMGSKKYPYGYDGMEDD